jgi:hypothetical protein
MPGPSSIHRTLSCGGYSGSTRLLPSNPKATGPHEPVAWDPASCLYDLPILSVLDGMGGAGSAPEVIDAVGEMVEEKLTENDLMENRSGVVRWKSRVARRRFHLVQLDLLERNSPRGTWEVSEEGRDALVRWEITYPG